MAGLTGQPAYHALAEDLRQKIEDGRISPGEALPSATALMKDYGVSSTVVKNAMRELRAGGYVVSHQGKAVYAQLPTAPAWLTGLIAAGSALASIVDVHELEGREQPLKDWRQALDSVPASFRRT